MKESGRSNDSFPSLASCCLDNIFIACTFYTSLYNVLEMLARAGELSIQGRGEEKHMKRGGKVEIPFELF